MWQSALRKLGLSASKISKTLIQLVHGRFSDYTNSGGIYQWQTSGSICSAKAT